LILLFRNNNN